MTDYDAVRTALGAAVKAYAPGLNIYDYVSQSFTPPAAIVKPQAHKTVDYQMVQGGGGLAKWTFLVMLVIGQIVEEDAQKQAGALVSPNSPFIQAINNTKFPSGGFAKVVEGAVSEMMFGNGLYTYAQLTVSITA